MQQSIQRSISNNPNIAAAPSIAARWSATRDKFLAPKGGNAIAAVASLESYLGAIDEHV
jgi:hypothetical protein